MSRTLLAILLFILFGVGVALFFEQDNGYVLMRYGDLVLETSLVFFTVALIAGLWLLHLAWQSLKLTITMPRWLPVLYRERRERAVQRSLLRGLLLLREGRWPDAEKALAKPSKDEDQQLVTYLNAAIAAQRQGATERRDYYLQQAAANHGTALPLAVMLTQAELQLDATQYSQALASLELIREKQADHLPALELLIRLSAESEDWDRVASLWPEVERLNLLNKTQRDALAERAYSQLLAKAGNQGLETLDQAWRELPRRLHSHAALRLCYLQQLLKDPAGHHEAQRLIQSTLKNQWEPEVALLFADISAEDSTSQLAAVEGWVKQHGEQPELQLLAGLLCLRNKLWGRARSYLESSLARQPDPRTWLALGKLNAQTDNQAAAVEAYANGLKLAISQNPINPNP